MKHFRLFFLVCLAGLASCEMFPDFKDEPVPPDADAVTLKEAIFKVARRAQGECDGDDNDPQVREALDTLTQRLLALTPERTEPEKLPEILGEWKQIWSDAPFTAAVPGACFDADEIYQVVFEDGFYYNISEVTFPGQTFVSFTRGAYTVASDSLAIRFTKNVSLIGTIEDFPDLTAISLQVENDEVTPDLTRPVADEDFALVNVYVDNELRIVADNPVVSEAENLFILERFAH